MHHRDRIRRPCRDRLSRVTSSLAGAGARSSVSKTTARRLIPRPPGIGTPAHRQAAGGDRRRQTREIFTPCWPSWLPTPPFWCATTIIYWFDQRQHGLGWGGSRPRRSARPTADSTARRGTASFGRRNSAYRLSLQHRTLFTVPLSDKKVMEMLNMMLGALAMVPVGWAVAAYAVVR
jgi:hypothetical protein